MTHAVVTVHDLHHTYLAGTPLQRRALQGAEMIVHRGEMHGLIGRNGAGKSTLVQFIDGLLQPESRGQVTVFGVDLAEPEEADAEQGIRPLHQRVGLVFQQAHHQLLEQYVGDDVAYGPRQMGLTRDEVRNLVRWALEMVGLDFDAFVDRHTFGLSGGEMRRVALAGVLAVQPELLILDEATSGLDPRGRGQIHRLLRRLTAEEGTTVILVSNDMTEIAELTDRVTVLDQGRTVIAGSTREVLTQRKALEDRGLRCPPACDLAHALGDAGLQIADDPIKLEEIEEATWRAIAR